VARQSAMLPSFEHARTELKSRGLDLPIKEVHRITTHLGARVLTSRKRDLLDYRDGRMPAGQELGARSPNVIRQPGVQVAGSPELVASAAVP
jgi:hypothetical protein